MRVKAAMTENPKTCKSSDTLDRAAQAMWENDCSSLPVSMTAGG
jgi:CBS domain-containing protein